MKRTADVVIIGGGIMGASTAYHLARHGCTDVIVLEAGEMFGLGSTGLNAGGVRHQFSTAVNIELSKHSIGVMERFAEEICQEVGLRRCGYLFLLDNQADVDQFRRNVELQNAHGVPSRIIGVAEIADLAPEVELTGIMGGSWCRIDGLVDPHGLLQGYVSGARGLGVTLVTQSPATTLQIEGGRVRRVGTVGGTIETRTVVIAAGPWSAQVGALAGTSIPIQAIVARSRSRAQSRVYEGTSRSSSTSRARSTFIARAPASSAGCPTARSRRDSTPVWTKRGATVI